jgi:amino acid adenylation domain-containing protein
MHTALESLVTALEQDMATPVCHLEVLPAAERRRLLVEWNQTQTEYVKDRCIHALFEAQAERTPDDVAVSFKDQTLTYGELNGRANRLAHYLRSLGVKPDNRIAVCAERSLEMVVAILGILKAGGAYVPLDPAYPVERLEYMLEDSGPVALLVHLSAAVRAALNIVLTTASVPVVDLQADARAWSDRPQVDLPPESSGLKPHHLAYVIYTSGSTGKPKGVMVEHSNVVRLFSATQEWFHFNRGDVWTLFHSYAFDFSVWEMWGALLYGGKLVVVPHITARSPQEFYRLLCQEGVTVLNQTPSAFRQLIAAQGDCGTDHRLRYVIFGGEALELSVLRPWYERECNRDTRLINMYGITETTVHVTYRPLEQADTIAPGATPIGCQIPDLTIYILDRYREPVPIGVAGELYVGGAGVARGYLNRPQLTKERFLPDPFSADPQARMYKTGDVGRFRMEGGIEYLGRNDHQVKIRGFRIELGEIEARLADHPSVREAVVLAYEDDAGDKRLVAYVIPADADRSGIGLDIDVESLRRHVSVLPEYMVPSAYVALANFPLTANGKLDRKALPSPQAGAYVTREYQPPAGKLETTIAGVWAEVLNLKRIGRKDNFFEIGGHSLLAVKVTNLLRQHGIEASVADVFNHPTIESLATSFHTESSGLLHRGPREIRVGAGSPLFLVHDGYGDELYFSALAQHLPGELPIYGLPAVPPNEQRLHTMHAMAKRMIKLIQEVQPAGPYRLAGWSFGGVLAYEIAQQLLEQGCTVDFLGLMDAFCPDGADLNNQEKTPEAVLIELCEEKRQKADGSFLAAASVSNLAFEELFNRYRALQALPDNFQHLSWEEARVQCRNLDLHARAMAAYRPRPINIPLHLFIAGEQPQDIPVAIGTLGWDGCVPLHLLHVETVPGSHQSMMRPPHIKALGQLLTQSFSAVVITLPLQATYAKTSD